VSLGIVGFRVDGEAMLFKIQMHEKGAGLKKARALLTRKNL